MVGVRVCYRIYNHKFRQRASASARAHANAIIIGERAQRFETKWIRPSETPGVFVRMVLSCRINVSTTPQCLNAALIMKSKLKELAMEGINPSWCILRELLLKWLPHSFGQSHLPWLKHCSSNRSGMYVCISMYRHGIDKEFSVDLLCSSIKTWTTVAIALLFYKFVCILT